jgi:hypothetical protein
MISVRHFKRRKLAYFFKKRSLTQKIQIGDCYPLKGIVGAVVIFDHGLKFIIILIISDHQAHEKLIASKKKYLKFI